MKIVFCIFIFSLLCLGVSSAPISEIKQNRVQTSCNTEKQDCAQCPYASESKGPKSGTSGIFTLGLILALASYYFFKQYKKKYILAVGGIAIVFLIGSSFVKPSASNPESCIVLAESSSVDEFREAGDEFISAEKPTEFGDEEEFKDSADVFTPVSTSEEFNNTDELSSVGDEFSANDMNEFSEDFGELAEANVSSNEDWIGKNKTHLTELGILLALLIVIGFFINNPTFRKLRPLFLLAMLVWLGFMRGGCPCMISSFHNVILIILGNDVSWVSMLWFLGLIPITYFLGKIWCGWLCHLGGLQEFLFSATKIEFLKSAKHQKIIKGIQITVFVVLLLQLAITHSNVFIHYDPFKVAFNLFSATVTGYVLLALLLVSSVLVYRPFCRAFCPVGLALGLVALLPKAKRIVKNEDCVDCIRCSKSCKSRAIIYENKTSQINIQDCIACGDCFSSCHKNALKISTQKSMM
ncbi:MULTISPECIES: 4Fe-4S binding protein [unclassified Saccharicrinis]|uniref:4Fe-4S binding protein n=1 Tax=unclassified Saccharicrinis TaxID=2646859 RepID=UPI003D338079